MYILIDNLKCTFLSLSPTSRTSHSLAVLGRLVTFLRGNFSLCYLFVVTF